MADSKLTTLSEISVPALEDLLYLVDDPAGTPASVKVTLMRLLGLLGLIPGGRLTLTTGVPFTTSDVIGAGTLYYTPYHHALIRIYDGTRWKLYTFSELSLALALTSGKNYDVFIYDNAGTLTLELSAEWTNDTTRADALTTQNGVTVKSGATTRLWLGTIRASGTNTTEDSAGGTTTQVGGKRFVWNAYNRVLRPMTVIDTADTWSYTTNAFRITNAATGPLNCVEWVYGGAESVIVNVVASTNLATNTSTAAKIGIGIDSATVPSGLRGAAYNANASLMSFTVVGRYSGFPGIGYHYAAWLERGGATGTCTFSGDNAADGRQTGLMAEIMA